MCPCHDKNKIQPRTIQPCHDKTDCNHKTDHPHMPPLDWPSTHITIRLTVPSVHHKTGHPPMFLLQHHRLTLVHDRLSDIMKLTTVYIAITLPTVHLAAPCQVRGTEKRSCGWEEENRGKEEDAGGWDGGVPEEEGYSSPAGPYPNKERAQVAGHVTWPDLLTRGASVVMVTLPRDNWCQKLWDWRNTHLGTPQELVAEVELSLVAVVFK